VLYCTWLIVNLLARYSFAPTRRHWNDIKDIFCYLKGTLDMGLFCPYASQNNVNSHEPQKDVCLVGYADAGYISDPYKTCSQTGYVFTTGKMMISWRSMKQILVATSSHHAKLIAVHDS